VAGPDESGLAQYREVVRGRRLGHPDTGLLAQYGARQLCAAVQRGHHPQPGGVGQGVHHRRQVELVLREFGSFAHCSPPLPFSAKSN
jgi:hypothetical protein